MESLFETLQQFLSSDRAYGLLRAVLMLIAGAVAGKLVGSAVSRLLTRQIDEHQRMIIRRIAFYVIFGLFAASALVELGFEVGVLLGAGGIVAVAIGFASQTSASNLISGLFLLGERPFAVGDVIRVGGTTGEVLSIDLLSVKLRTFDNLFVRIPNETMINSEITNLRRFPIRRYDLQVGVAYKEDLRFVQETLLKVADGNPLCLEEPKPLIIFQGYGDSGINYQFSVWAETGNFLELRRTLSTEIKEAFDENGIEIPFPHRTLYTGSATDPFPLSVASGDDGRESPQISSESADA